jgi:hypothetical protein
MKRIIPAQILLLVMTSAALADGPSTSHKLDRISRQFDILSGVQKSQRTTAGWMFLSSGALSTGAGIYMLVRNSGDARSQSSDFVNVPALTTAIGATFLILGGVMLAFESPYEGDWRKGLKLAPDASDETRLKAMEGLFEKRASDERGQRQLGAGLGFGIGALATVGYFSSDRTSSNQSYLFLGALETGFGIASLLTRGYHENAWEEYTGWARSSEGAHVQNTWPTLSFGLTPTQGGAIGAFQLAI